MESVIYTLDGETDRFVQLPPTADEVDHSINFALVIGCTLSR
jgi:hypothetical protein